MAKSRKSKGSKRQGKQKPQPAPAEAKVSILDRIKERWGAKAPIFLFLLAFAALMSLYYLLYSTAFYQDFIYQPAVEVNAFLGNIILNILGQNTVAIGQDISSSRFAISISQGCDGLEPMALFASAILAYPISMRLKLPGLGLGLLFLLVMNLVRIVTLFLTGVYWVEAFDAMHLEVWQALFLILAVGSWLVWIQWAMKKTIPATPTADGNDDA